MGNYHGGRSGGYGGYDPFQAGASDLDDWRDRRDHGWGRDVSRDRAWGDHGPRVVGYPGGYYGQAGRGGQSYSGGQRVYPGDPAYRGAAGAAAHGMQAAPRGRPHEDAAFPEPQRRGPRGFQRSDESIRDDLCDRLASAPGLDVRDVSVEVGAGVVTLSGTVRDRWQKYLAEEIADEIFGVDDVHNRIRVSSPGRADARGNDVDPARVHSTARVVNRS